MGARALLTIKFLDGQGEAYSWAPKWNDTERLFLKAINVESFNKPESEWLPRFSRTVKETAESAAQPSQDAFKLRGRFMSVTSGKLVLEIPYEGGWQVESIESVMPLFPVDVKFLDTWLNKHVEVLVVNNVCVQVLDQGSGIVHPLPVILDANVDDLPF